MEGNNMQMENSECNCSSKTKKILNEYCKLKEEKDLIELLEKEEKIKSYPINIAKGGLKKFVEEENTELKRIIKNEFNYRGVYIVVVEYNDGEKIIKKIIKIGSAGGIKKMNNSWKMTKQKIGGRINHNTGGLFSKIREKIKSLENKNENIEKLIIENTEKLIIYAIKIEEEDIKKGCELTPRALEAILIDLYIKITGELPLLHNEDG